MDTITEFLRGYTRKYLESRNAIFRDIEKISEIKNSLIVEKKAGRKIYLIQPFIFGKKEEIRTFCDENNKHSITCICFNTLENIDYLKTEWRSFVDIGNLSFFFFNPFSKNDRRWAINPRTHSLITDKNIEIKSIDVLYDNVDLISEKKIKEILK